jgi:hypothetical protein
MPELLVENDNRRHAVADEELSLTIARQGFFALTGLLAMLPPDAVVPVTDIVAITTLIGDAARRGGVRC